jgi:outer membrane protein OmpA-like peptidoglycan-associated protein
MNTNMRAALMVIIFIILPFTVLAQHVTDTFHLYFDLNIPELNRQARSTVDSLVYNDRILPGKGILIVGYADYLGTENANKTLSEARADNVRKYLATYAIQKSDIKLCIGRGQVNRQYKSADGYPADRKVDIVVESMLRTRFAKPVIANKMQFQPTPVFPITHNYKNDVTDIAIYAPGQSYILKNIYFLPERHTTTPQSIPELEKLYKVLLQNPNLKIRIEGHVCCIRDYPDALDIDANNLNLSVNRAKAIYDYLVEQGIDAGRLKYAGYGRSRPIVPVEVTEEDANKNRRVEIRVLAP